MFVKLPGKTNTFRIYIKTALEKGVKVKVLDLKNRLAELSYKNKKIFLHDMLLPLNNAPSLFLARQKCLSKKLLQKHSIMTASGCQASSYKEIAKMVSYLNYPLVVKPAVGGRGLGVTTNITSKKELKKAIQKALDFHDQVLIEKHYQGTDFKFLVLENKIIGIVSRRLASVVGNGQDTLKRLIKNKNQKRFALNKKNHEIILRKIRINDELREILQKQGFNLKSIPSSRKKVLLSATANWSKGSSVRTFKMSFFHSSILKTAVKTAQVLKLKFCAVDFIIKNPKKPLGQKNGVVLEVNSYPGINIFHYPSFGKPQKLAEQILDSCFRGKTRPKLA